MRTIDHDRDAAPLWVRRPEALLASAYVVAGVIFAGQLAAAVLIGSGLPTILAVLAAGAAVAVSWWLPWTGLVLTSAASLLVTAVGENPVSVWMIAVLVLFSFTLRGRSPILGTVVVAAFFFAGLGAGGDLGDDAVVAVAALFSAIGGGATGSALRLSRNHWLASEERARSAVASRESEATRRVAEERLRIARDLHDVVGHQVAMLSVNLGVAEIGLPDDATSSRRALDSARSNARSVVSETQRILVLLRRGDSTPDEDALRPTPSLRNLDGLIASFESIGLTVDSSIDLPDEVGEPAIEVTVYRIVQEALTNAYRYGEGPAAIDVHRDSGSIHVSVKNLVGRGSPEIVAGGGLGLVGMRERVESCGGTLTISDVDGTFLIAAEFSLVGARLT